MRFHRWIEARDGTVSERSVRRHLENLGYKVQSVRYPPGTWVPTHSHADETIDAVVSGTVWVTSGDGDSPQELTGGCAAEFTAGETHDLEVRRPTGALTVHGVRRPPSPALWRYLAFAVLLAGANYWSAVHLGFEVDQLVVVNTLAAVLPAVVGVAGPGKQRAYREARQSWLARMVSTPGLVTLGVLLAVVTSFSSSVVFRSQGDAPVKASISPEEPMFLDPSLEEWAEPGVPTRFWRLTYPFGRWYTLKVKGYRPRPTELSPWWPTRLTSSDLIPEVTLLVRLDPQLPHSGLLVIEPEPARWTKSVPATRLRCTTHGRCFELKDSAAFLLGLDSRQLSLTKLLPLWKSDLGSDSRSQQTLLLWLRPAEAPENLVLHPKDRLTIRFLTRIRKCQGEISHTVSSERLQDLYLRKGSCGS